ncbi:hypothetical protein H5U98_22525 [Mycolicibacterium boenickei]|uniref:PE-PGRS family protein n=1 Tax=Mycolicibacterium boenickei TaxID=146017 RepID=A0AAX2ZSM6_9MYCO|nr:hypothetical protein [Mycolicibacterium boenickei]UNB98309.1 hypothetical protein H5U98_22525 [Mycolicibacterium boenickei]BBX94088.1 hypothetical protein MBOE_57370 [Mycolicibacterium boenickei]
MHVAARSYLTTGAALVGAGAIAVSPLAPVSPAVPEMFTPTTQSTAVDLTAAANPIVAWSTVLTEAFGNTARIADALVSDPAPILRQVITNDIGYATLVGTALAGAVSGLATGLTTALPAALQTVVDDINAGDYQQAGLDAMNVIYSVVPAAFALLGLASIAPTITQNLADATQAAVGGVVGGFVPLLGTIQGTLAAVGVTAQSVADSLESGDIADAVLHLVNTPATLTGAVLNGYTYEFYGSPTTSWGLLSYDPAAFKAGSIPAFLVNLPRAVRDAIKPASTLAAASGDAVTLDVAADPAAEKAVAPTELAEAEQAPVAEETPAPAARQLVRGGPVGTPGEGAATGTPPGAQQAQAAVKKVATSVSDTVDSAVSKLKKGFKNGFTKPAKAGKHAKTVKAEKSDNASNSAGGGDSAS